MTSTQRLQRALDDFQDDVRELAAGMIERGEHLPDDAVNAARAQVLLTRREIAKALRLRPADAPTMILLGAPPRA
jgi:hypothetical protein